jgi:hypothetical protein
MPPFISTEGLVVDTFCKKEEFQKLISDPDTWKFIDNINKNKLIYMYDLSAMIGDLQNYVLNIHHYFIEAAKLLFRFSYDTDLFLDDNEKEQWEYKCSGYYPQIISSMYMNVIIQLNSCLDIIAKLFCEILNMPNTYEQPIKYKSGSIYFSNIKRFQEAFRNYEGYGNSLLEQCDKYNGLVLSRHLIIHNSYFSSSPMIFHGYATSVVNYKKIYYSVMYIWDVDNEGRPERWLNRCKFYGQQRTIDDYIIMHLIKFYEQLKCTLELIISYLDE